MSRRQDNRNEVCAKILAAAEEEFGLKGFNGASLQHIAARAELPKANIVYYFESKLNLYKHVLNSILDNWNDGFDKATVEDDPAQVLEQLIRYKLQQSFTKPRSSRIFAMEVIQGAEHIDDYLSQDLHPWILGRVAIIQAWIAAGKMHPIDPLSLIYLIWATTQHYADFEAQVHKLSGKSCYEPEDIARISDSVTQIILTGCGLSPTPHSLNS